MDPSLRRIRVPASVLALALLAHTAFAEPAQMETVELVPEDRAGWSVSNLFAPFAGLLRGDPDYWYETRVLEIDTTPPGAILDLFYVRSNFQKGYEQADAPVRVILPSRVEAGPRDGLTIRALLDGHRQQEVHVPIRSSQRQVMIDLEPLPNQLQALTHVYLGGRASLTFITDEALTFRVQKESQGFQLVLTETGIAPGAAATLEGIHSSLIDEIRPQQLGEDLVVRVKLSDAARRDQITPRSYQAYDPVRGLHSFRLDLAPSDGGAAAVAAARAALDRIDRRHVSGCALEWDRSLREQLEAGDLARALAPSGSFTDPYLRAAMRRLGEVSPDASVRLGDGTTFRVDTPIELMAAASQAHEVQGYLALLRRFVAEMEAPDDRDETLRGLVAPEVPWSRFEGMLEAARGRERRCLARAS
jgi:hypothetical protein